MPFTIQQEAFLSVSLLLFYFILTFSLFIISQVKRRQKIQTEKKLDDP